MREPKRWTAVITYITDIPTNAVQIEELDELRDIVEYGPNWNKIGSITITLNRQDLDSIDVTMN